MREAINESSVFAGLLADLENSPELQGFPPDSPDMSPFLSIHILIGNVAFYAYTRMQPASKGNPCLREDSSYGDNMHGEEMEQGHITNHIFFL